MDEEEIKAFVERLRPRGVRSWTSSAMKSLLDAHQGRASGIHGIGSLYLAKVNTNDQLVRIADIFDIPNTIINILTDHNKAGHDALLINADLVDAKHFTDTQADSQAKVDAHVAAADPHTQYGALAQAEVVTGLWTAPAPTAADGLARKGEVDDAFIWSLIL